MFYRTDFSLSPISLSLSLSLSFYTTKYKYLQKTFNVFHSAGSLSTDEDSLAGPEFSNSAGSTNRFFP